MAKRKLTKAAIIFIVEKRNDWHVNYTFDDIAKLLREDFGITVSEQGVGKSYRKYKDNQEFQSTPVVSTSKEVEKTDSNVDTSGMTPKEKYERRVKLYREGKLEGGYRVNTDSKRDFDEDASKKYNIEDFFVSK